jgi:hypothetical protein
MELRRGATLTSALVEQASASHVDAIWLQAHAVDSALGLSARPGYARLVAPHPPSPLELPQPPRAVIRDLEVECYSGIWGYAEPGEPDPTAVYVGLREGGEWVGICECDRVAGWILGPGVRPGLRTAERYARLVRGAAAFLAFDRVTLETWGDSAETLDAYLQLGFAVVEYVPGWELDLRLG